MREERLRALLEAFPRLRILVVGDFFLDRYLVIDPALEEVSLETGLPCHQVVEKRCSPGAAGTVVSNLAALGVGTLYAAGVLGDDGEGYELKRGLAERRVRLGYLFEERSIFTPTYTKPMRREAGVEREMERVDIKNRAPLPSFLEARLLEALPRAVAAVDGVIVADQVQERNHGVITDRVRETLASLALAHPRKVFFVDSRTRIGEFRHMTVKPNRLEVAHALGLPPEQMVDGEAAAAAGRRLADRTGRPVLVTLGPDGSVLCTAGSATHIAPGPVQGEVDPVGAGDSTTAGTVAARCAGASWEEAAYVGNLVASVTVQKLGTTGTATPDEVLRQLARAGAR